MTDPSEAHAHNGFGMHADGISVVLPAFNAADVIVTTIEALRVELQPLARALEFIVVDDCSSDATAAVLAAQCGADGDVRLLRNRRNFGKGTSVYLGVLAARFAHVCFTDADLAFTSGSYARVVQRLLSGRPLVVASRRLPDSEIRVRSAVLGYAARRHAVGVIFNYLVRYSLRLPFRDTQCGLKGFRRNTGIELLRCMRSGRFLFDIEMLIAARAASIAVDEVPVSIAYTEVKSTMHVARDSAMMLLGLATIAGRDALGRYAMPNPAFDPAAVQEWAHEASATSRTDARALTSMAS